MKYKPYTIAHEFRQRAGARLRDHEARVSRLRTPFEIERIRVELAPDMHMPDVHTVCAGYFVVVHDGVGLRELRLADLVGKDGQAVPDLMRGRKGRAIKVELLVIKTHSQAKVEHGYRIEVELIGMKEIWPREENASAKTRR